MLAIVQMVEVDYLKDGLFFGESYLAGSKTALMQLSSFLSNTW
jgi:hypothetical protein